MQKVAEQCCIKCRKVRGCKEFEEKVVPKPISALVHVCKRFSGISEAEWRMRITALKTLGRGSLIILANKETKHMAWTEEDLKKMGDRLALRKEAAKVGLPLGKSKELGSTDIIKHILEHQGGAGGPKTAKAKKHVSAQAASATPEPTPPPDPTPASTGDLSEVLMRLDAIGQMQSEGLKQIRNMLRVLDRKQNIQIGLLHEIAKGVVDPDIDIYDQEVSHVDNADDDKNDIHLDLIELTAPETSEEEGH